MEATFSAIIGDIITRSISFLMDKYAVNKYSETTKPTMEDKSLHELQRLLCRANTIIEEAEGRIITNRAMTYQLNILRKETYRGFFAMDKFRIRRNDAKDHDVSNSSSLSKLCPAKRFFFSTKDLRFFFSTEDTQGNNELKQLIRNLNDIITDASELVVFLKNYPPMYRQPYNMHLFIGKCIFGRQMEMDRIIDFLLQKEHPCMKSVDILPIVGPGYVGKSTLVAHVCNNKIVRNHFSQIVIVNGDDINDKKLTMLKDGGRIIHQNCALGGNERSLVVIEFSENVDKAAWNSWHLSLVGYLIKGSKIIITSRSDKIIKFGTTQPLRLNFLPLEAYWYFFKILIFGSADPSDHPKLESIGMEMARVMSGSFIAANQISGLLRDNFISQYWCTYLAAMRENIKRNISLFGDHPHHLTQKGKPTSYRISTDEHLVCYHYRSSLTEDNVPAIPLFDVLFGKVKCEGELEACLWKSHILPYKSYITKCMVKKCTTYSTLFDLYTI
ncbi:hypothetical protein PR202_gb12097 [Eleusine coracana subsp. coracana]|uniref:NB-ARC domain-containing protein n=1 Tax=Eleusine coracana subsp. coracana TaxID=191504 RepID=A0AAV5EQ27_ELECO|nr:hypothetical protein PR202_gb12097 [Eleusine coracana subsp. coracana]